MHNYEAARDLNSTPQVLLIDYKTGEKVVTMPSVFNIISSFGEGYYMLEQHLWSFSYYGRMGGYSDGLLWFYTGADIKSSISEVNSLTEADVSRDSINSMVYGVALHKSM